MVVINFNLLRSCKEFTEVNKTAILRLHATNICQTYINTAVLHPRPRMHPMLSSHRLVTTRSSGFSKPPLSPALGVWEISGMSHYTVWC